MTNLNPTLQQSVEKMIESNLPDSEHEFLSRFTGKWQSVGSIWWNGPGAPPLEGSGLSNCELILGNRWLKLESSIKFDHFNSNSLRLIGFDKQSGKFSLALLHDLSTCIWCFDDGRRDGRQLVFHGLLTNALSGDHDVPRRYVFAHQSKDHFSFEIFDHPGTPLEFLSTRVDYIRANA